MYRQHYPNDPGMHNMPENYGSRTTGYIPRSPQELSIWERIKSHFVAILVGNFLIYVAIGFIFWNEGRAVQTSRSLQEGLSNVRSLSNAEVVFDHNNGKLVHITGPLQTSKILSDEDYFVTVPAVKLLRGVEMYQWVEIEDRREIHDGDTVREEVSYSYSQQWRVDLIRSTSFNNKLHSNPEKIPVESKMYIADDPQIGSYSLSKSLVEKITNFRELHPSEPPKDPNIQLFQGAFYHGGDPLAPMIGDVRIVFEYAGLSGNEASILGPPDVASVLAKQVHSELTAYQTEAGDTIELLYIGHHTAEHMIGKEQMTNALLLWALRLAGWLVMFIGFGCLTSFLVTMVDRVRILREIITLGAASFSFMASLSLSLFMTALSWVWFRPYLGLTIFILAFLPYIYLRLKMRTASYYRAV